MSFCLKPIHLDNISDMGVDYIHFPPHFLFPKFFDLPLSFSFSSSPLYSYIAVSSFFFSILYFVCFFFCSSFFFSSTFSPSHFSLLLPCRASVCISYRISNKNCMLYVNELIWLYAVKVRRHTP